MSYYIFLLKKTFKNRGNLIPLFILLIGVVGLYTINISSGDSYSYINQVKEHYNQTKELEEYYLEELNGDIDYPKEDIQMFKDALEDISEQRKWNEQILELAVEEKWSEALGTSVKILNRHLAINEDSGGNLFPPEYVLVLQQDVLLYNQLAALNYEPDTKGYEKFGFNYVFRVMDSIFPIFFVLIIAILLTEVFLNSYRKENNIEILLPNSYIGINVNKIIFATLLSVSIYTITLLLSFIIASVISGVGSVNYPISLFVSSESETASVGIIIIKMFVLQAFSILNIVLLISLISSLVKNRLISLLISIITIIGSTMALKSIESLHLFVHLNPFTYFLSGDVVTGLMAQQTNNANITFGNGVLLLSLLAIFLLVMIMLFTRQKENRQMLAAG